MQADGAVAEAVAGGETGVVGLQCVPTNPASLSVMINSGAIFYQAQTDASSYGPLSANANPVFKVGTLDSVATLNLTAPSGSGQSINYLIEVSGTEQDDTPVINQYYDAANPSVPFAGQNNSSNADNTVRRTSANVNLNPGAPASTGSQTTPAAGIGYTGLYIITVSTGQTVITPDDIVKVAGAPFISDKLNAFLTSDDLNGYVTTATLSSDLATYAPLSALQNYATKDGATLTNAQTTTAPTSSNSLVNKSYVDSAVQAGVSGVPQTDTSQFVTSSQLQTDLGSYVTTSSLQGDGYLTQSAGDGRYFQQSSLPSNASSNGYTTLPGGIKMQFGYIVSPTGSNGSEDQQAVVTFPIPFANIPWNFQITTEIAAPSGNADEWGQVITNAKSNTGFTIYIQGSSSGTIAGLHWLAIGI